MNIRFEPVMLDSDEDANARLVFRGERLAAVVSRLDDLHDRLAGRWFIEAVFDGHSRPINDTFPALADVEAWIAHRTQAAANNNEP
jgi:xanthine dehydrogenase iron-sulfur cluster and FAD-binding subunit A